MVKDIEKKLKPLLPKVHIPAPQKYQLCPNILCCFLLQFCPILLKSPQVLHQNLYFSPLFTLLILLKCSLSFRCSPASFGWFQNICITQPNTSKKPSVGAFTRELSLSQHQMYTLKVLPTSAFCQNSKFNERLS